MASDHDKQRLLRRLPAVDKLLEATGMPPEIPRRVLTAAIRHILDDLRNRIVSDAGDMDEGQLEVQTLAGKALEAARAALAPRLKRTINATGVVVHTNLGRSRLAEKAIEKVVEAARHYSNLEFDLKLGKRGSRYSIVEELLCELSGAEAALVVNNNAGAVLLCLETLARGKEVVISRGELVEIGGSFRIPDVMAKSGALLKEVGTTNRTHPADYRRAIDENTGLLLKAHTSNYAVVGFTSSVSLAELVKIGAECRIPVMEDLGSGSFVDLSRYGLMKEPTVQESVASGADLVTFSGDKLLGGPQAGLIVGRKDLVAMIKANPLARALRIDKMTLAALEATFQLYRDIDTAVRQIPTLAALTSSLPEVEAKALQLARAFEKLGRPDLEIEVTDLDSRAGGGSLPLMAIRSKGVAIRHGAMSVNQIESGLRHARPPVIGRIENDRFIFDARTIGLDEIDLIAAAVDEMLAKNDQPANGQTGLPR